MKKDDLINFFIYTINIASAVFVVWVIVTEFILN